jgi:pimeloyl-ACP methyl ester carboxylesterase
LSPPASNYLPAFRAALAILPESNIVTLALSQPAFLGIAPAEAQSLQSLCGERYRLIRHDAVFRSVSSALPYCFSEHTPTNGLALVFRPKESDSRTPCLLFLHGYGGSFLWYQHLLAESFPDHIVVCPAFGVSPAAIPPAYVNECLAAVARKLGHPVAVPALVGLSAGGFGAARIYTQSPKAFSRLILIASYPPSETLARFTRGMSVYAMAGAHEDYVRSGLFRRSVDSVRPRVDSLDFQVIPNSNHYFLLARREETLKLLRSWLK